VDGPATGCDERPIEALALPEIDAELATVWPRPRRVHGGTSPDVQRIALLMSTTGYAPLRIDDHDVVIDPDGEAILEAARSLGWRSIRVRVEECINDPIVLLGEKLRREHYPTSRIVAILTSPIFWRRFEPIVAAARARMKDGRRAKTIGRSRDLIAESIGMIGKGRSIQTMLRARRTLGDEFVDAIARGDSSMTLDGVQRAVRERSVQKVKDRKTRITRTIATAERPWRSIFTDNWQCTANTGRFGLADFRGGAPDEVIANLIDRHTEPGDLVVDPMAGSGRTIDLAKLLKRKVVAADQRPLRTDIIEHRIERGPIPRVVRGTADLVLLDPPYFDMMSTHYGEGSSSSLAWDEFCAWLRAIAKSAYAMARRGGVAGTLIMNGRAPDRPIRMLRRELERAMEDAKWRLEDEFVATTSLWPYADMVQRAQQEGFLLGKSIYVQTWRR
jgi:hypothetical protein